MSTVAVRAIQPCDVTAILQIQSSGNEAAQWSRHAYENLFLASTSELGWVAENGGCVIGFIVTRQATNELEILNLAIAPAARRQGAGKALLQHAFAHASEHGAQKIFLEVRASNLAARGFYSSQGFINAGRRPNYYTSPVEDALLLARSLPELSGKINRNPVLASRQKL